MIKFIEYFASSNVLVSFECFFLIATVLHELFYDPCLKSFFGK